MSSDSGRSLGRRRQSNGLGRSETQLRLADRDAAKRVFPGFPVEQPLSVREADEYLAESPLTCLICGRSFRLLSQHLRQRHSVSADEYKARYHLPFSRALCTADVSKIGQATQHRRIAEMGSDAWREFGKRGRVNAYGPRRKSVYRDTKLMEHKMPQLPIEEAARGACVVCGGEWVTPRHRPTSKAGVRKVCSIACRQVLFQAGAKQRWAKRGAA